MKPLRIHSSFALAAILLSSLLGLWAQEDTIVVFNEAMYHPAEAGGVEWIELHNQNGVDVDISEWSLDGGIDFEFPEGTVIPGRGYLIIASDPAAVEDAMGPFTGQLDNNGEEIRLLNNSGRPMSVLDYGDSGEWPVAPDGSGVTLAKVDPDGLASRAASWSWSNEIGGTPGAANFPEGRATSDLVLNEMGPIESESAFIEIYHRGASPTNLEGYRLLSGDGEIDLLIGDMPMAPGDFVVFDREALGIETTGQGDQFFLFRPEDGGVADAVILRNQGRGRLPDGGERWLVPSEATPGAANVFSLQDSIVINEIMYHHRPRYAGEVEGQPYLENPEEWVELHNRGDETVDLTNWRFDEGIQFTFPEGTELAPGAFIVVARDAAALAEKHPDRNIVGDFAGELNNREDHLVLCDPNGNPADEVHYFDGGRWPGWADGYGSSLELRDPHADNAVPESWGASDESTKSSWQDYVYRGTAERPPGTNFPTQWREFVVGLLDKGEFLIDDINVVEDPDGGGPELIRNSQFSRSIFGGDGSQNWRFLGNHGGHGKTQVVDDPDEEGNTALHVVATGPTEHMHNHLETTLSGNTAISVGTDYEISFRAKWLRGSPMLHTRLYFNYLARKTILDMPDAHGSPGQANSILVENMGPSIDGMRHDPVIPDAGQAVTVTARANDPDGVASMVLKWSTDGIAFEETTMTADGNGAFQGSIPGQAEGAKIQFYIEATDGAGAVSWFPADGPESRAMCPVQDGQAIDGPGHTLRIVMHDSDRDWLHEVTNVMSNDRMPCTLIYREKEVYYDAGVRLKGSQRGRARDVRVGFTIGLPADQPFRGLHRTIAVDRSGAGDQFSQKEILVKHAVNRAGDIPGMYDDLIYIIAPRSQNTSSAMLLMARYDDEYLDGQFEDGSEGRMFEYELIYYPTTTDGGVEGLKRPNPDNVTGVSHRDLGPDPETYRWHYLIDNNRKADDYSGLMEVLATMGMSSGDAYQNRLEMLFDVDQWLRSYAIQNLFGIGDNYATGAQHNMIIYLRPSDEKALYFPWDMDFTFSQSATSGLVVNSDLQKMLGNPVHERSYYAQMNELLETVFNRGYMERWAEHYSTFLPSENLTGFLSYIDTRNSSVTNALRNAFPKVSFAITTNGGEDFTVDTSSVTLEGTGWYDIATIRVNDGVEYEPVWVDLDRWELTVPLQTGENALALQALDVNGTTGSVFSPVGKDTITVTNTGQTTSADASNLVISEIMYHPGTPTTAEAESGFADQDTFEFIELVNLGDVAISLNGVRFVEGIFFDFNTLDSPTLAAGARLLLVSNEEAFRLRYGESIPVAGVYEGRLRNSGETLSLVGLSGESIRTFSYNDGAPWPAEADGQGQSLVLLNESVDVDFADPASWTASSQSGGTPGAGEAPVPGYAEWIAGRGGDGAQDPNEDGIPLLLDFVLGTDLSTASAVELLPSVIDAGTEGPVFAYRLRNGSDVTVVVELSEDLQTWRSDPGDQSVVVPVGSDANGDGTRTLRVRAADGVASGVYWRLRVTAP